MSETREPTFLHRAWHTPMRDLVRGRMSERLDWRGTITKAALPEAVKPLLHKLVRRTRLWRLEKADVAREMVAHFEDALAAGRGIDEAIERFGDWHQTAKLIRRATKRKRSYVWHAWRWSFWSVVVLLGLYTLMGVYYATGSRNIAVDYAAVINEEAAAVPEDQRAWPVFRAAMLSIRDDPAYTEEFEAEGSDYAYTSVGELIGLIKPGDPHWDRVDRFLSSHQSGLAELRRAAGMPGLGYVAGYYHRPEDLPLFEPDMSLADYERQVVAPLKAEFVDDPPMIWMVQLPHVTPIRLAAFMLDTDTLRALEAGDAETVYANLVALLGLADHADEQNTIINQLVTLSIRQLAFETLSEVLVRQPDALSSAQLTDLAHRIAAVRIYTPDFAGERAFMLDLIQHTFTDDGAGNGHLDTRLWHRYAAELSAAGEPVFVGAGDDPVFGTSLIGTAISPAAAMIVADRKDILAKVDHFYALYQADLAEPMWRQPESRADAEVEALIGGSLLQKTRYFPIAVAMPALGAVRKAVERYTAYADGALTAIALELYRREQGGYPDTLGALVPRYLPEVPIDRITGGPVNYRVTDGGPVLYSFGADHDDDNGTIAYDEDDVRLYAVREWVVAEGEAPVDGDWVVWPLHKERAVDNADEE